MKYLITSVMLSAMLAMTLPSTAEPLSIIPNPVQLQQQDGNFDLNQKTIIISSGNCGTAIAALESALTTALGKHPRTTRLSFRSSNIIKFKTDPQLAQKYGTEAYRLEITPKQVIITGATPAGVYYGVQTLRQLLPPDAFKSAAAQSYSLPCLKILDHPAFKWRGMMVDSCRHFLPVDAIKRFIDTMALYKFNTMHWHLTEDQGWRIEIKKYPRLTQIGSVRAESPKPGNRNQGDGQQYGPYFYTQDQIREIVAYAKARFITIVPEIEMPGHSLAALASYPNLGCTGGPYKVRTSWGVEPDIYCAGNDEVFTFLQDVLTEVMELFPSTFIHVGGDEAPKARWKKCPKCQARIKAQGLKNEHELQSYFIGRMDKFLDSHGRRLIGWDEILEGGLAPGAAVMSWRGTSGGIKAAKAGHDVVMSPNSHMYFDHYQARRGEPEAIGGFLPLEKVYSYDPLPKQLTPEQQKHIIGVQANLWSEYIRTPQQLEYMAYPRAFALAEVAWSGQQAKPPYSTFLKQAEVNEQRLKALGVNYRKITILPPKVGSWKSGETSETFASRDWNITSQIKKPGTYTVTFQYTGGTHRLDIQQVEILEDGKTIVGDKHDGTTGASNSGNTYRLKVPAVKKGAKYSLRAVIRSDGGNDSNGDIYLKYSGSNR